MEFLTISECREILNKCLKVSDADVLSYELKKTVDAGAGFIGAPLLLHITAKTRGKLVTFDLFTKILPLNDYHRRNVETTQVFYKEAEFFKTIVPGISKFLTGKTLPECYHADPAKILVFENLSTAGYKNADAKSFFDVSHCKSVLSALASLHAASFLLEKSAKSTIDQMYPHLGCDKIAWFKNEKGHPGYEHCMTGVRSLSVVLDRHFAHVSVEIRDKVKTLLESAPSMILPSKKYRNALSHLDLWCNNVMFKYNGDQIEDCVLIDFQLWGYLPPASDVLSIIYITTDKPFRDQHMGDLLKFYYDTFTNCIKTNEEDPAEFLTWDDFKESASESLPLAVTNHAIFLQICLLPEDELLAVWKDESLTREFYEVDRSPMVLRGLEKDHVFRRRLFSALNDCIDYVSGKITT